MKRVAAIADLHCGHAVGLTPPDWEHQDMKNKLCEVRRQCWDFYEAKAKELGPFDVVIAAGDLIDGKGTRVEGVETIVPDRLEQVKMATRCLQTIMQPTTKVIMAFGTDYHVGTGEDFEVSIKDNLQATIGNIAHVDIESVIFEAKHHVGNSQVPHTRHTAIARDRLWNLLWADRGVSPRAQVILRAHVHYFNYCGGTDWVAMTLPALQGFGSRYGARRMSGLVDFGFVVFTVDQGKFTWEPVIASVAAQQSTVIRVD